MDEKANKKKKGNDYLKTGKQGYAKGFLRIL